MPNKPLCKAVENPLTTEQIQDFLDYFLGLILSEQHTAQADALADCALLCI